MSKPIKITIIIASILVVLGIIFCVIALANANWDINKIHMTLNEYEDPIYVEQEYFFAAEGIKNIDVDAVADDTTIIINPESDEIRVVVFDTQFSEYTVETHESTLSVIYGDANFPFSWFDPSPLFATKYIEIWLPEDFVIKGELAINLVSGDIETQGLTGQNLDIETVSGNIKILDNKFESIEWNTVSGSSQLINTSAMVDTGESVSGDIDLDNCEVSQLFLNTVSGEVRTLLVGTDEEFQIKAESVSGDILTDRGNPNAANKISVETISGDIDINFLP